MTAVLEAPAVTAVAVALIEPAAAPCVICTPDNPTATSECARCTWNDERAWKRRSDR